MNETNHKSSNRKSSKKKSSIRSNDSNQSDKGSLKKNKKNHNNNNNENNKENNHNHNHRKDSKGSENDSIDLSNLSQEELDALYDAEEEAERRREREAAMSNIMDAAAYAASQMVRLFIDYGPPYEPQNVKELETLCYLTSDPNCNPYNVHRLLNQRIDPNIPDDEELYYTPMHWCARNTHLLCMRMLRRAKAKVDCENEFGQTPLHLCVMVTAAPNKREKQFKMVKYLIKQGARINSRDKGGYSPIDYAVMSGDQEMAELLLSHGANVERTNETLVAKRKDILSLVPSNCPDLYKLLNDKLQIENQELAEKQIVRKQVLALAEEERRHKKLHEQLMKRKQQREAAEKAAAFAARRQAILAERDRKIKEEWDRMAEESKRMKYRYGEWKKVESSRANHWTWVDMREPWEGVGKVYRESEKTMSELHLKYGKTKYDEKWKQITGKHLEVKWTKDEKFKTAGDDEPATDEGNPESDDIRDENDSLLANENIDDVLGMLNL